MTQAVEINRLTKKPVLCTETFQMIMNPIVVLQPEVGRNIPVATAFYDKDAQQIKLSFNLFHL